MLAYLSRLTTYDWIRIISYLIAGLTIFDGKDVLMNWGMTEKLATTWASRVGDVITVLTLMSNAIKNPSSPKGTVPVVSTTATPTPDTLTTAIAPKG